MIEKIIYDIDKENVVWYFKDFYFVFDEICEEWGSFYRRLKGMCK